MVLLNFGGPRPLGLEKLEGKEKDYFIFYFDKNEKKIVDVSRVII